MMFKKVTMILMVFVLIVGVMTGCAKKETNDTNTSGSNTNTNKSESSSKEVKNTNTIQFTYWGSTYEKKVVEAALKKFEEKTGYKVEGIHVPSDYETKLTAMIAGNQAPDCGYLGIPTAYKWFNDGILQPLNEIYKNDENFDVDNLVDGAIVYHDEEDVMGLFTAVEGYSIIYNKDMFDEAGITPPNKHVDAWTWDEFVEVAKEMTIDNNGKKANESGFDPENIKQYGISIPLWFGTIESMMIKNDGKYLTEDGKTGWTTPETLEVLQKIQDLMYVHYVMPTPTAKKALPSASISLQTKKYAMVLTGQWDLNGFAQVDGLNVDLTPVPVFGKSDTMLIGSGEMAIFKDGDNKEGAWELIKFLTSPENSIELYRDGLWMPIYKDWYTDESKIEMWTSNEKARPAAYKEVMMLPVLNKGRYLSELYVKNFNDMHNLINPALDKVWAGEESASEALKAIEDDLNKLCDGTYGKIK